MKKRVFIIHGWGGGPECACLPWLKNKLEENGFEVFAPKMPNTDEPEISEWVNYLAELVDTPDKQTYFIGHSIGCQAIMRYLQTINQKVGGAIFIAGWFMLKNLEPEEITIAAPWVKNNINFEKLKKVSENYVEIISDNDPFGGFEENKRIFFEELGAKLIVLKNAGHIEDLELPIALEELIRISK
ncbi:MAG TPA: alpha/beta fold hydrolase [Candidatus Moranbacteria bacterium]|nr:alpha/beta fold hydrolase [Candidatus Moranbacteria bacterium]HRY27782.1 alpha/beta fold hydrolase [Candidatus Moranbacteria bacterium]HSA08139.1 alpha/beta fold hydrolase [Candidatus Moranbacteria bacterium]